MNIKNELLDKIAIEDNFSFLLELNELMPEILTEIRFKLLEKYFTISENWKDYKIYRIENEVLSISKECFASNFFFKFTIYFGNDHGNMFFGIKGPWYKSNEINEIAELGKKCEQKSLSPWSDWMFKNFNTQRDILFNSIKKNQEIKISINSFEEEFYDVSNYLFELLNTVNEQLRKKMPVTYNSR